MSLRVAGQSGCCGAALIYGFGVSFDYNTGRVNASSKSQKDSCDIAEREIKLLLNTLKGRAQVIVYLNAPQCKVYEEMLVRIGFVVAGSGENMNHIATSPIKTFIYTPNEGGTFDKNRKAIVKSRKEGRIAPREAYPTVEDPFPEARSGGDIW